MGKPWLTRITVAVGSASLIASVAIPASATENPAATPATTGPKTIVALGDSYLSGQGGRWAGNGTTGTDALGPNAYFDNGTRERTYDCHRATSAPVHIGGEYASINLACSGSTTRSYTIKGKWKPGIDNDQRDGGLQGQALQLQLAAIRNQIDTVVLSVGGNDFGYSDVVTDCITSFRLRIRACSNREDAKTAVSAAEQARVRGRISDAVVNIDQAMLNAGYSPDSWKLIVQTYPVGIATSGDLRYSDWGTERSKLGGCPLRNRDADWLVNTFTPIVDGTIRDALADVRAARPDMRIQILNAEDAFAGHELCAKTAERVSAAGGVRSWTAAGAADASEWLTDVKIDKPACSRNPFNRRLPWCGMSRILDRLIPLPTPPSGKVSDESLHPNYWGQLALRNCLRQVVATEDLVERKCTPVGGVNALGEPNMAIQVPLRR